VELYRIPVYNTSQYKELALRHMYSFFLQKGAISSDVSFEDLVPRELLEDTTLEVDDVLTQAIITGLNGEFLKNKTEKLCSICRFYSTDPRNELHNRMAQDAASFVVRLQDLRLTRKPLAGVGQNADANQKIWRSDKISVLQGRVGRRTDGALLRGGTDLDFDAILSSDAGIRQRARSSPSTRPPTIWRFTLTKDIIPHRQSEYYKTNWELDTPTANFSPCSKTKCTVILNIKIRRRELDLSPGWHKIPSIISSSRKRQPPFEQN